MDSHDRGEEQGLSPDRQGSEDGANYLRRMKESATGTSPSASTATPAAADNLPAGYERRRSPRLRCSGSAEFRVEGNDVRMWGTLSDVSRHGCYVEMANTFPVNTRVMLTLEAAGVRAQMHAVVRVSYPFLGMGMCFTEIELGQQAQLDKLLAAVAGSNAPPDPALSTEEAHSAPSLESGDAKGMLDEMFLFFRKNSLLSRAEFNELVKKHRGS